MDKISFDAGLTMYEVKSIQPTSPNVLRIIYADEKPDESVYGLEIMLFTSDNILEGVLTGWTTIYKIDDDAVYLSNDGSVYTEPEPQSEPDGDEPEPYEPTIGELQANKISEMESTCATTIKKGIDVNGEHFTLDSEAQMALLVRQIEIITAVDYIDFYPDGEPSKYYSADEMQEIIDAANDFINGNQVYCNELCLWIKSLTDKDEIAAVYYGMDIPEGYRSDVLEKMLPVGDDETGMIPQEGNDDGDDGEPDNDDDDDTNIGAGGEIDVDDPADVPDPADEGEPADDSDGDD